MRTHKPRPILASYLAALAMIAPLFVSIIVEINTAPIVLSSGEVDDAGMRGAAVTLIALPFIYIVGVVLCHVAGYVLLCFGFRKLRHFMAFAFALSFALVLFGTFGLSFGADWMWTDIGSWVFLATLLLGAMGSAGAAIWWWIAVKPDNPPLHSGRLRGNELNR